MKIEFKVTRKPKGFEEKGIEIIKRQATEMLNKRLENSLLTKLKDAVKSS
jgi:secreted Zn-dependent insulinase-like peptidase